MPVFGMPILVAALEAQPPVQVAACDVSVPIREPNMGTDRGTTVEGTYSLHVRFAGAVAQPISRVIFALSDGTNVVDVGHF
ncbi:MAG TPA: hypothetical protein VE591_14915, partial [Candidatus Acidoferrum sp.]|nr:hypothetical protein [Candidatus Acidoferrum sp.]